MKIRDIDPFIPLMGTLLAGVVAIVVWAVWNTNTHEARCRDLGGIYYAKVDLCVKPTAIIPLSR